MVGTVDDAYAAKPALFTSHNREYYGRGGTSRSFYRSWRCFRLTLEIDDIY
jgi:hypothetical protein